MDSLSTIRASYRRLSLVYDVLEGAIFHSGRKDAVGLANRRPNQRILDVGVGTGLALPLYRRDAWVVGIDASPEMLERAQGRVRRKRLTNIAGLLEMDAQKMAFADRSFDAVVAMHVASVVPDPLKLIAEMKRVCVPGGDIVVVNHFASSGGPLRVIEEAARPFAEVIGFRPDVRLMHLADGARLQIVQMRRVNLGGYWRLIHFRNTAPAEPARQRA
jgi:phosphatidylethanolamine/phosphatidyl-N-methylethanolamine N-methyltransferase